jgi:hypothetical protein
MSFNLRVKFTGLIGFVKNEKEGAYPPWGAILVDGSVPRRALDGTALCTHRAFVKFPINTVEGSSGISESFGIWYLDQERIYFDVTEDRRTSPKLIVKDKAYPKKEEPDLKDPESRQSLYWMMDLKKLYPQFRLNPETLGESPSRDACVGAQIAIDRGVLSSRYFTNVVWDCGSSFGKGNYRQVFTHVVNLSMEGLKEARIVAENLYTGSKRTLDLSSLPITEDGIDIDFYNVCSKNPLEWPPAPNAESDQDTKWFFEFLLPADRDAVRKILGIERELPMPKPYRAFDTGNFGSPGSGNCLPPRVGGHSFEWPHLKK